MIKTYWGIPGLAMGLFFIVGSAQAQTHLTWDSNGNILASTSQAQINQFNRDLTAYNEGRKAGAVKSAVVDGGKLVATRAATLNFGSAAGLGRVAALGMEEFVRYPLSSVGKGLVTVARLNPLGIAGTVAATILLEKGISVVDGVWMKAGGPSGNLWRTAGYDSPTGETPQESCGKLSGRPYSFVVWRALWAQADWCVAYYDEANGGGEITSFQRIPIQRVCSSGLTYSRTSLTDERCTPGPVEAPATDQQMQDAIATGITENPSRAPEVLKNIYDRGGWVPLDAVDQAGWNIPTPTVEGKPEVTTTTSTAADGTTLTTTKTTTPKATVSSSGDNVTNNTLTYNITNVTSSVTRNQFGDVVSSETTTEDKDSQVFQDAAMPEYPSLYTQKYPDGIQGVWDTNKPDISSTPFFNGVKSMFPSFGAGQCPIWTFNFNLGGAGNFGSKTMEVPCWIFQAIGLVMLATATFTARKIIF